MQVPATVKAVGQYIKRAEDAEKDTNNPEDGVIIAYWCRQWAIEKCIPFFGETEVADFVSKLMDIQDANKEKAGTKEMGKSVCEANAMFHFDKADTEDRAGNGNKGTAKLFYNAATYLDTLEQFEGCKADPEIEQKRVYAKWKAHDILTALQQGRQPTSGPGEGGPGMGGRQPTSGPGEGGPSVATVGVDSSVPAVSTPAPAPAPVPSFQSSVVPPAPSSSSVAQALPLLLPLFIRAPHER
jgi:vacuolar protein sorting-associated protein VTA1